MYASNSVWVQLSYAVCLLASPSMEWLYKIEKRRSMHRQLLLSFFLCKWQQAKIHITSASIVQRERHCLAQRHSTERVRIQRQCALLTHLLSCVSALICIVREPFLLLLLWLVLSHSLSPFLLCSAFRSLTAMHIVRPIYFSGETNIITKWEECADDGWQGGHVCVCVWENVSFG